MFAVNNIEETGKRPDFLPDEEPEQPSEVELAFDSIRSHIDEQLAECDEKLEQISTQLPPEQKPARAKYHSTSGTGGGSWQIMLGFGISLTVRLLLWGVALGGWLDRRFFGGNGYAVQGMILLAIVYSFFMLYHDVMRHDRRKNVKK